ncbi:MAG: isopeptide-forming domain-containing fimbrial protein, partial [Chitinophagaceae bacterium]
MIYRFLPQSTFKHLLALVAFLCLSTISLYAQKTVNFTLAASIDNAAAGVNSGDLFIYKLNYQCSSFDTSGRNVVATLVLPDKVVPFSTSPFSSSVSFDDSQVASVTYNAATKTITVTYVDPLPAGSSGQLQIRMKYENGTTPNGYSPDIITTIDASNNLNPDNSTGPFASNSVTIPAIASNKYTIGKVVDAGGAIDDITIFKLNISASGASSGALNLQNPVVVDTLPPGVVFDKATKFSGSNAPVYNPVDRTVTWTWPSNFTTNYSGSAYISVKYTSPTYAVGANACNSATLSGTTPGLPIGTNEPTSKSGSVCFNIESPSAEIICTGGGITAATASWLNKHILAGTNGNTFNVGWANNGNTEVDTVRLTYNVDKSIDMNVVSIRPVYDGFDSVTQAKIEVWYATNLNGFTALGTFYSLDIANGTTPVNHTVSLPSGEYITQVRFVISGNLPIGGYQSLTYSGNARTTALGAKDGTPIVEGITYKPSTPGDDGTVVNNISSGSYTYKGITSNYSNCGGVAEILRPQPVFNTLSKTIISGSSSVRASDTIRYQFQAQLGGNVNATNVVISDTLDSRLTYIPGSSTLEIDAASSPITPVVSGNILTYNLGNLVVGKTYRIKLSAVINPGTAPGTIPNQMVVGSDNALLTGKTNVRNATVISAVALRAYKGQSGCDPNIVYYPTVALAQEGGPVNYKITLRNLGNVPAKDLVLVDVFPFIGDTRGSQWYANLAAPVSINDPLSTIHYTTT